MVSENKFPVSKNPSMLELHWVDELSEPSSASVAEPWNITELPSVNAELFDGEVMDTLGAVFGVGFTVIVILSVSDIPSESVAVAVTV